MLRPWLLLLTTPAGYHSAGPRANRRAPQSAVPRGFAGVYGGSLPPGGCVRVLHREYPSSPCGRERPVYPELDI
jgi:hypothetical protein